MIEGFTEQDAKDITRQVNQGSQDQWPLTPDDLKKLNTLLHTENALMRDVATLQVNLTQVSNRAISARDERDSFCRSLEQTMGIPPGTDWTVDLDKGLIIKKKR